MIDLDVFTPSDDRAVRLVVGKTADQSEPGSKGRGFVLGREVTVHSPAPTPHASNDDYRRVPVIGSIR
jgi:hypothetical protein